LGNWATGEVDLDVWIDGRDLAIVLERVGLLKSDQR
jgi:hypothetical protein